MSENTNTLFWVITGAVVVLGVFLLINNSLDNNLSNISDTFNSYWTEAESNTPREKIDERYISDSDNISFIKLGEDIGYVQDLEIKVYGVNPNSNNFGYYIKNTSSNVVNNKVFHLNIHRYSNKEVINSFTGYVNNLYPGNQINFSAWASENLSDEYYYELVID